MDQYKIKLDRKVLKLLGSQLYGDTPSVIAELVANSYDADATNVWITIDSIGNNIVVEDDGTGMDANDINNSFLNIGYDKRSKNEETNSGRKVMGRKGIGKLATFSLTNYVSVLSSKGGRKYGCLLDFQEITMENKEPATIASEDILFEKDKLSESNSGTRLELNGVKKKVGLSYRFIVSKLIRIFDVNDRDFNIHIRKDSNSFKLLHRTELDYFSIMDTIITIGKEHEKKIQDVKLNNIENRYKSISTYDDFVTKQTKTNTKTRLNLMPYDLEVEGYDGKYINTKFSISGWIGTVCALPKLSELGKKLIENDDDDEGKITVNDNRISLYSRGKLGEYDIIPKIKSNRNSEAYVIGELIVDIFEDNNLIDMAISNRRGYEENDNRYTEVIKIAKRLLRFIIQEKDDVSKLAKDDKKAIEDAAEAEAIKAKFWSNSKTKEILDERLNSDEKDMIQSENLQFTRAVNCNNATKRIFISHRKNHKLYGKFIVDVLEEYGIDIKMSVIFTSDRRLSVPQGKDIYDYLKQCFREDLMVIFLFSKAFYDSNICLSEAGAAWATNQNCLNAIIDIEFDEVEKPSNNALSSIKFSSIRTKDQRITLYQFFSTIITTGLNLPLNEVKLNSSIEKVLKNNTYSDAKIDNPEIFCPTRKFLPYAKCAKCMNKMTLVQENSQIFFKCSNVLCDHTIKVQII